MKNRQQLWVRLTATLCVFMMMSLHVQPVLAAVARSAQRARSSERPAATPSRPAPAHATQQAKPAAGVLAGAVAAATPPSLAASSARKQSCKAQKRLSYVLPGSGAGTPGAPDPGRILGMPSPVTAADGGDAQFNRGLARLFAAPAAPREGSPLGLHNQYSDDECDDLSSPVPPFLRQAHPLVEDVGAPYGGWALADRETTLEFEDVKLIIPAGALVQDTRLTIRAVPDREAGALDEGMTNVVPGQRAFRLGPHGLFFQKPITVILPYSHGLLPPGMSEEDLGTFYFDNEAGRWRRIHVREVREGEGVVIAETEHFTDFLNATLTSPDHPTTASFDQNTFANLKAGDPAAGIELIRPPGAASDGAAHLGYHIMIPPGRRGMQPDLTLEYNSDASNGWLGLGWNLAVSKIQVDTRFGAPEYSTTNESELYALDGAELTPKGATAGPKQRALSPAARQPNRVFVRRTEGSFSTVTRHGSSPVAGTTNSYSWEVIDKNGTRYLYGTDSGSVLKDPTSGNIAEWLLASVVDTFNNSIHYEYQFDQGNFGIQPPLQPWVQAYPKLIRYTDNGATQGHLYLQFELESDTFPGTPRPDPFTSAREGFLVRTARRLHALYVAYSPSGVRPTFRERDACPDPSTPNAQPCTGVTGSPSTDLIRRYLFSYATGEYQKSLLQSVDVQSVGFAVDGEITGPAEWQTEQHTALNYYQRPVGSTPSFGPSIAWGSVAASQFLSDSSSKSVGANAYVGLGVCSAGHIGGGGGLTSGDEATSQAFLDFNGDGLPDFLSKNQIFLGHRSSTAPLFSMATTLNGDFFTASQSSQSATVGLHLSQDRVSLGVNWSWDQSTQQGGFADVDGDGFVDWITPTGSIQRNQGDATTKAFGTFQGQSSPLDAVTRQAIEDNSPRADTVVRWTAPYHGTVALRGPVQRKPGFPNGGEVLAEIWQSGAGAPTWSHVFAATDTGVCTPGPANSCTGTGALSIPVNAGDRFYFRTRAQDDISGTALLWDPQFSYQTVCNEVTCNAVSAADHGHLEPWGAPIFDFSQASDFRLAGPPDRPWPTQVPAAGIPVKVLGTFSKTAPTADDVTLEVRLLGPDKLVKFEFSQVIAASQTPTIDLTAALATAPLGMSATLNGAQLLGDSLLFRVRSDSPVDPAAFTWDPVVKYERYCRTPPQENAAQVCGIVTCPDGGADDAECTMTGDPMPLEPLRRGQIYQHAPVTYSTFLVKGAPDGAFLTDNLPTQPWQAPESGLFDATLTFALGASAEPPGADDALLLIQGNQRLLGKLKVQPGTASMATLSGLSATANEPLYFSALRKGNQELALAVSVRFTATGHVFSVPISSHRVHAWDDAGENDNLSGGYHQWSTAQWTEVPPSTGAPIPAFSGDRVEAPLPQSSDPEKNPPPRSPVTPTVPLRQGLPPNLLQELPGFPGPVWASSGSDLYIAAGEMKPSRTGANPATIARAVGGPAFRKSHGSSREGDVSASAKVIGGNVASSTSDSSGDADTLDLNGDRYPDWTDGNTAIYGDATGGFIKQKPVGLGQGVRQFTGGHARFGISGNVIEGIKHILNSGGSSNGTVPVAASIGRVYGRTRTTVDLVDVNGDGLPDRLEKGAGASLSVRLNLGYSFGPAYTLSGVPAFTKKVPSDFADFTAEDDDQNFIRLQTDVTNSLGGSVSAGLSDAAGVNGGGGLAYTGTRTLVDLADVNGDGLPDRVLKVPGDNALRVELNLGEQFAPEQVWNLPAWGAELPNGGPLGSLGSRDALAYSEGTQFHLDAGFSYEFPIYLALCGVVEAAAQYRHTHSTSQLAFEDVDGDGFADQLLKNDGTGDVHVKLNQDGAQHFNLLKTVDNPLGGRITLNYSREGNTVALPENQWVLASVSVDDGLTGPFHDTVRTSTFQYTGGLYNRDERERFGSLRRSPARGPDQSKVIQSFRQDAVCTKGLPTTAVEQDAAGHLFRSSQTIYDLRAAGASDACFPAATQEVTSFFDGITTDPTKPSKTLAEQRDYDAFGNVTFYSNAGDTGTADDLSYTVTYDPTLSATHIFRANLVTALDAQNKVLRKRTATYFAHGGLKTLNDLVNGGHDPATGNPFVNQSTPNLTLTYTPEGNLQTSTDPTGFALQYTYDPITLSYITSTQDSFGYVSTATVEPALGVFTSITDVNGNVETFNYDANSLIAGRPDLATPRLQWAQAPAEAALNTPESARPADAQRELRLPWGSLRDGQALRHPQSH